MTKQIKSKSTKNETSAIKKLFGYPIKYVKHDYKFVYSSKKMVLHDKSCKFLNKMNRDNVYVTSKIGDIYKLPLFQHCRREIMIRMLSGNKYFDTYNNMLRKTNVSVEQLHDLVFGKNFLLEGSYEDKILITYGQDKWILQLVTNDKVILWHGNYIRSIDGDRFHVKDYHKQYDESISWEKAITTILQYDYEKYHKNSIQNA